MRRVIYGAACSLDGYIATSEHGVDWLHWSDDVGAITGQTLAGVDTIVMGRRTYEVALRSGTRSYPGYRNVVFSRTLPATPHTEVELVADSAVEFVGRLRGERGGGICVMGGGQLASALLDAGLIDEVGVNVQPVLLGDGIPMFPRRAAGRLDLTLMEARPIAHGCVYALYRVNARRTGDEH